MEKRIILFLLFVAFLISGCFGVETNAAERPRPPLDNIYCHAEYRFSLNHSDGWHVDGSTLLNFNDAQQGQNKEALPFGSIKIQFKGLENRSGSLEKWVQKTQDRAYASAADFTSSTPLVSETVPYRIGEYEGFSYVLGNRFYAPTVPIEGERASSPEFQSFQMLFIEIEPNFVLQIAISNASAADDPQVVKMLGTILPTDCLN